MASTRSRSTTPAVEVDQPGLPGVRPTRWRGPVERSIAASIKAADHLSPVDGAAVALLRSIARNVDWCERNGERHTHALQSARMSELLTKLRMEPSSRGEGVREPDAWDAALADLGTAAPGNPAL